MEAAVTYLTTERLRFVGLMFLAHEIPFWGYYLVCSYFRSAGLFSRYLIQAAVPPATLIRYALKQVMVSQWLVQWPMLLLAEALFRYAGLPSLQSPLPSIFTCAWHLAFYLVLCDTLLYWIHRTFHHPLLYARIHKQHHEFKQNIGISSEYFHPLEDFGTGVIPTVTGPLLLARHGGHPLLLAFWIFLRVSESCDAHCGFDFPYSPFRLGRPGDRHDFHHSHNIGNFSAFFCFWDRICGTDQAYLAHKEKQRLQQAKLSQAPPLRSS